MPIITPQMRAQSFASGQEVKDALAGKNPGYATSILYRYNQETDPAAKAVYAGLVKQLQANPTAWAEANDPNNAWQGKSHNFFVENPWAAPIAEIGAAAIPGIGPLAAGAIAGGIGAVSRANIGSGVNTPGYGGAGNMLEGGAEGGVTGYGANKLFNPGGPVNPAAAVSGAAGLAGKVASAAGPGGGGGGVGPLPGGSSFLGIPGLTPLQAAELGLAGAGIASGSSKMGQANTLINSAISKPSLAALSNEPDLSGIFRPSYNPYTRTGPAGGGPGMPPMPPSLPNNPGVAVPGGGGPIPILPPPGAIPSGIQPLPVRPGLPSGVAPIGVRQTPAGLAI